MKVCDWWMWQEETALNKPSESVRVTDPSHLPLRGETEGEKQREREMEKEMEGRERARVGERARDDGRERWRWREREKDRRREKDWRERGIWAALTELHLIWAARSLFIWLPLKQLREEEERRRQQRRRENRGEEQRGEVTSMFQINVDAPRHTLSRPVIHVQQGILTHYTPVVYVINWLTL